MKRLKKIVNKNIHDLSNWRKRRLLKFFLKQSVEYLGEYIEKFEERKCDPLIDFSEEDLWQWELIKEIINIKKTGIIR